MSFKPVLAKSAAIISLALLSACGQVKVPDLTAYLPQAALPAMRWDARPEAPTWTSSALAAVARHDSDLATRVPADIETFCPGYETATLQERRAFWVGLMSSTAKHESSFNPKAAGGGGRYIGLMQISPRTAQHYDCTANSSAELKDGSANLECAVKIFAPHVAADGMVAGKGNRGVARDWGPFSKAKARAEIASWTANQAYCKA